MLKQNNLLGETLELGKGKNPLEGLCCQACYNATEKKCTCKCHGAYHGLGRANAEAKAQDRDKVLPENEAERFRKQYDPHLTKCRGCDTDLSNEPILYYTPHPHGWIVDYEKDKVWLFVKCPKCKFDLSLQHMGVPRE